MCSGKEAKTALYRVNWAEGKVSRGKTV